MELIDKAAVIVELEKQVKRLEDAFNNPSFASYEANLIAKGGYRKLKDILSFIDTLDVKEVTNEKTDWFPNKKQMESLKDMFPQAHWKPSDEQMEVLYKASKNEYLKADQYDVLLELWNNLKKLKEE